MMRRLGRYGRPKPPPGWEIICPTLEALEAEMRDAVNNPHEGRRKTEAQWPIHQINWQRSRYVYDMYYKYKRISRRLYDYCIREKLVDGMLCAKWKKPGYNRLCSVHVINSRNTNYGTTSICRVPRQQLRDGQSIEAQLTGCRGCCSGRGGYNNIFGNKYGQYLAAIQVAREEKAKESGAKYAPDKTKKDWQFAADYDENIAAKADANVVADKRKKDPIEEGSWLGGAKKRKPDSAADEEAGKRKKVEAEAAEAEAPASEAAADGGDGATKPSAEDGTE